MPVIPHTHTHTRARKRKFKQTTSGRQRKKQPFMKNSPPRHFVLSFFFLPFFFLFSFLFCLFLSTKILLARLGHARSRSAPKFFATLDQAGHVMAVCFCVPSPGSRRATCTGRLADTDTSEARNKNFLESHVRPVTWPFHPLGQYNFLAWQCSFRVFDPPAKDEDGRRSR